MKAIADALNSQIRNIEARYGKPIGEWTEIVRASGSTRHSDIISMLKSEHSMTHGDANRVALVARDAMASEQLSAALPAEGLFSGARAGLKPIHSALMEAVRSLGADVEVAPKRAYLSLRRRKQFAMMQPAAGRVDLGLILKGVEPGGRLEASGSFNAMFTHRVRLASPGAVDAELVAWLRTAYEEAS